MNRNTNRSSLESLSDGRKVSCISLSQVTDVMRGIQTNVFAKSKQLDPNCCLSIITIDRSLDIVLEDNVVRNQVFKALKVLLEEYEYVKYQ